MGLDEALERALKAYDRERLHTAPVEVVAQNLGYKSANNGAAMSAIASLRYFGMLERPKEGLLSVSREVEAYKFAPSEVQRHTMLLGFLTKPPLYGDLLEKFQSGLPSEANLKYELIGRGFAPPAANAAMSAFIRSVNFVGYFNSVQVAPLALAEDDQVVPELMSPVGNLTAASLQQTAPLAAPPNDANDGQMDRIPVRLPGRRRAWLVIPSPFFSADKVRLKAQIDLLLTEDEETGKS